ncbi:MAG TPA: cytochrome c [Albitalea sp.]
MTAAASSRRRRAWWLLLPVAVAAALAAVIAWLNLRGEPPLAPDALGRAAAAPELVERGAYLARAGNCVGCHTLAGDAPFAGGRGVETPFGTVFAPNITPDAQTGIGGWSSSEFWRALHHGRSKVGRLLYPAFPYPSFTLVTRDDSDALFAFLRSVQPVNRANTPHALRFPYGTQAALAVWRALFFRPGEFVPQAGQGAQWNRGRYLVEGLGHCAACHSGRNILGATRVNARFAGGLMPDEAWYAPSLANPRTAGVQEWQRDEVVMLLKNGVTPQASVAGPMAEVVYSSTQYLGEADLAAMARYLQSLPVQAHEEQEFQRASADVLRRGAKLYEDHCAACHGAQGEGVASIYPALAGNRSVTLDAPNNLIQIIRRGGFPPSTAGNPRPFGMPPFQQILPDEDIAAVATFVRQSWGNAAAPVSAFDVHRTR